MDAETLCVLLGIKQVSKCGGRFLGLHFESTRGSCSDTDSICVLSSFNSNVEGAFRMRKAPSTNCTVQSKSVKMGFIILFLFGLFNLFTWDWSFDGLRLPFQYQI